MLRIKHLASASLFNTTKFSADSSNTTYYIGNNTATQIVGTPDVLYEDLVFCKGCDLIYTHGHFYGNQPDGNFVKQIADLATYNGVENEIVQYVGEDTNDYKRGFFYKMAPTPTTTTALVEVMGLEENKGYPSKGFDPYDPNGQDFWVKEKHPNFSYLTGLFTTGSKAPTGNNYATTLKPNTTYRVLANINSNGSGGYFAYDVNDTNVYQLSTAYMQIDAYANNKITVRDNIGHQYEQELTNIETITADYCVSNSTGSMGDYYTFNINFPKNANTKLVVDSNITNDSNYELMEIEYETVTEEREVTIMQPTWQQIDIQPEFDVDSIPLATTSAKGLMSAEDKKKLDDDNFIGIFTSGNIEDIINSCTSQKQSGYCYINLETTTGSKPSSAGAVFVQFWSFESQTGCVCLYAHKINSNTAYRGYMANNTLVWQTFN